MTTFQKNCPLCTWVDSLPGSSFDPIGLFVLRLNYLTGKKSKNKFWVRNGIRKEGQSREGKRCVDLWFSNVLKKAEACRGAGDPHLCRNPWGCGSFGPDPFKAIPWEWITDALSHSPSQRYMNEASICLHECMPHTHITQEQNIIILYPITP